MKQTTIQSKLIRSTMMILGPAFLAVILAVIAITTIVSNANLGEAEKKIRAGLVAKGRILVSNNSQALQGMVADNAFMAVQTLVGKTVSDDDDVVYGIFMDVEKQPWVMADDSNKTGAVEGKRNLEDSMSAWAASLKAPEMRATRFKGKEVLEFAAPIVVNDETLGTIRYGLSTEEMRSAVEQAHHAAREGLLQVIAVLLVLGLGAAWASFAGLRRQAQRITKPVGDLARAASTIAGGDYGKPVEVKSDDEIGALSENFESMRQTVKKYTEHLEELVQEKMQQVRDILENIDQGLFTVNFDGSINPEYSQQANTLLQVQDVAVLGIKEVFRLSESQLDDWRNWIALVQQKHASMRWEKLARLSPVQDLELGLSPEERRFIKISYQKVYDRQQNISRIMVLAQDQTEARRIEQIVAEEKLRHENEVKTILGLVNNVPEVIHDFMQDLDRRLHSLHSNLASLLEESERARTDFPDGSPLFIDPETVMEIFRDLHTIKGNSATYGFETLSRQAHEAEEVLEALKPPVRQRSGATIRALLQCLDHMDASFRDIQRTQRKLSGGQDEVVVHVPEHKLDYVRNLAEALSADTKVLEREMMAPLLDACKQLRNINIIKLVEKYRGLVRRLSDKLEKHVELEVQPNHIELDPHFFSPFDEALVHILRNAVDHAIEPEDERIANRKDPHGRIRMILHSFDDMMVLTVADDGRGIDVGKLVSKAIANGILDSERAAAMDDREKLELVFEAGLSTSDAVTDISGRGVGMSAVRESIQRMGGRVTIQSTPGKGTQISLHLPPQA